MTFKELNLSAPLLRAVQEAGYETPSPIQAAAIPPVLAGRDLMGCAQTGTGKTAAFALPMLDRLTANAPRRKGAVRALILTPTRELALQIGESFEAYGKYLKLRSTVIFGGVGQAPQVEALKKGVDILIACPGRLNDLIGQGFIDLSALEIFVLDEADRMLDMGFVHDVKKVIAKLPAQRQNLMFSATMPAEIEQLAAGILRDPAFVKVDPVSSTVDRIQQSLYYVEKGNKKLLLPWLIKNLQPPVVNALVFSRTKHGADKIAKNLTKQGIPAAAIHGNKSQTARVTALEDFKSGKTRVLVATDIAARGIDISELSHVFNYDLPPFAGILFTLGFLWFYTDCLYNRKKTDSTGLKYRIPDVLTKVDFSTILFFFGILMAVAALEAIGLLHQLSDLLNSGIHNVYIITGIIGFLSSVIDNVPLVAAAMGMYPLTAPATAGGISETAYLLNFVSDGNFWKLLAYCAGTGGSILIIGSAAGVVVMGLEKISFTWYMRHISWIAITGFLAGIGIYYLQNLIF